MADASLQAPRAQSPEQGREPFEPLGHAALDALRAAFDAPLILVAVHVRAQELRLEIEDARTHTRATVTAAPNDGRKAFVTSRRFAFSYDASSRADRPATALVRRFALSCARDEVEVVLLEALRGGEQRAFAESLSNVPFEPVGVLEGFALDSCDGDPVQPPRRLGPTHLVLAGPEDTHLRLFRATEVPDRLAVILHEKNVRGRAVSLIEGREQTLVLAARCATCASRLECAGVFQMKVVESPIAPVASRAECLVVQGADLLRRKGRAALGHQLRELGHGRRIEVVGRSPTAVLLDMEGREASGPRTAEPSAVAASLRGSRLKLIDYRLPGRHGADTWSLVYSTDPDVPPLAAPAHLTVLANRKCVTVCRYCNLPLRLRDNMTATEVFATLEEAAVLGTRHVELFGGEVTLRKDLYALVAFAGALGLKCDLTTTGVGLDDDALARLAHAGINDLSISLDSTRAEVHDHLKNRDGMFDAAVTAARALKRHGAPWVGLNTVLTRANWRDLPGLVDLCAELGLQGVTAFFCQPLAEIGQSTDLLHADEVRAFVEDVLPAARHRAERHRVVLHARPAIDAEAEGADEPTRAHLYERVAAGTYTWLFESSAPCRIVEKLACVQPSGDVRVCNQPIVQFAPEAVVGNLAHATLAEILASETTARFRKRAGRFEFCRCCTFIHEAAA